jgi:peptidoglycan/LPS O-acetylase OafA/YrhL
VATAAHSKARLSQGADAGASVRRNSGRLLEIESLRGVAATSILIFHCWVFSSPAVFTWNLGPLTAFMQPLQSGVTLFFVLSGFLLYRPVVEALAEGRAGPRLLPYLRNRALRILPAYWAVLLLSGLLLRSATTHAASRGVGAGALTDPHVLGSDLALVQTYRPSTIWTGVLPAWSLTVEVAFYLTLPLLALAAARLARRRLAVEAALVPAVGLLVLGAVGKLGVALFSPGPERTGGGTWHAVLDRSMLTHADLFAFGMAAAVAYVVWERRPEGPPRFIVDGLVGRLLAYVGLPVLILGFYLIPAYLYDSLVACFAAVLLLRLLSPHRNPRRRILTHRWAVSWGRLSYGVFLWNFPVLTFLALHGLLASGHGALDFLRNLATGTLVVGALAFLTYRFVEAPALALKRARRSRRRDLETAPARAPA